MRSHIILGGSFLLLLLAIVSTCGRQPEATSVTSAEPEDSPSAVESSFSDTPSSPVAQPQRPSQSELETDSEASAETTEGQLAKITASDPGSEVNVRSLPSQAAESIGFGKVGDEVVLGRSETAEDGYTWHYVTFREATTVGWVREDLLDIQPQAKPAPTATNQPSNVVQSDTLKRALDEQCGNAEAVETYFITQSHLIYVCKVRNQRLYLSQEQGTEQVVTAQNVEAVGGGYIISNGNFEYRLDSTSFVVILFDESGRQEEVLRENVVYSERYG